ncbi:helix-turn-helix transcriptional regulator [Nocardioides sp.]|uniref:helix-turn-helix transcriptional regulator n=1 Tax=Nocardioides sp. TaxID=35761 RepID=UPI002EDB994E
MHRLRSRRRPIVVAGIRTFLAESADASQPYPTVGDPAAAEVVIYDVFNLATANGDLATDPTLVRRYDTDLARVFGPRSTLLPRRKTVLSRVAAGYTNDEIAAELYISINPLMSAIRGAYSRIGFTNRAGAVAWPIAHGYQTPSPHTATA